MNNYIYVKKELFNSVILPLEVYKRKNGEQGMMDALVGMGCEVMSKAHLKRVARIGDFILAKYDGWFWPFEAIKRDGDNITFQSYFSHGSFKEFRKKLDPDFYSNAHKWFPTGHTV